MGNETEVIRQQMAETRSSLQDKLETLEQQVKETVQEATDSVQTVKEAVQETVGTVKETVQDTVESVKGTVQDTVESVKQSLNVSDHVRNHPWLFFAGAATVGLWERVGYWKGKNFVNDTTRLSCRRLGQ